MKKTLLVVCMVTLSAPNYLYSQGGNLRSIQVNYTRSAQTDKVMGRAIWITDTLLQLYRESFRESEVFDGADTLWIFRLFLNTHSPAVNFTEYKIDELPYITLNSETQVNVSKWIQGESGMPSHHIII